MTNKVTLAPHMDRWKEDFDKEASKIKKTLDSKLLEIHHIGSTAVPGIFAKPIIDILPVVRSLTDVDLLKEVFVDQGYIFRGEFGIAGRRYLVVLAPNGVDHLVHIHIFQDGDPEIVRHLFFRDFLISNPYVAKEYEKLKLSLKDKYEFDRSKYQSRKSKFCEDLLRKEMGANYLPPKRVGIDKQLSFLTHYHNPDDQPFQSLSTLSTDEALKIIGKFDPESADVYKRFKNPEKYLSERSEVEGWIRSEFIKKGGQPENLFPYYLVLGTSSYIYEGYNKNCSKIEISLSDLDLNKVSFTYTDSMVSYWLANKKKDEIYFEPEYHGKVFTYEEILQLIDKFGHPSDEWKEDITRSYDFFIEAQVWYDEPVRKFI
jgi:GrpB-like predicted nucleotidyltransferase (UPF0157 family)